MRGFLLWLGLVCTAQSQTFQVTGTVVDHLSNHPLIHVLVHLGSAGRAGGSVSALTESDGRFSFTNVPAGKYRLTAQRRGETAFVFQGDGTGVGTSIVVGPGQATTDLIFPLRAHSSLSGVALDDQGEPVSTAQVHLFSRMVLNGELQTNQQGTQSTNTLGQFHFGHLRPGTYYVAVSGRPWYATPMGRPNFGVGAAQTNATDVSYPLTWYGNTTDGESATPIMLQEGAALNVQVTLHALPNVHIKMPASMGERDNLILFARGPGDIRVPFGGGMITGRGEMREMGGFPAGRYEATLNQLGKGEPRSLASATVDLTEGATLSLPTAAPVSVKGQVIFTGGKPEKEVQLFLNSGLRSARADVAADGSFSFPSEQIGAGSYTIRQNSSDVAFQSIVVRGARRLNGKLEIPTSGNVVLTITIVPVDRVAKIEGMAVRDEKGSPGAMVVLVPQDVNETELFRRSQSDSDGSFTMGSVPAGRYTLIAIDDGSQLLFKTATVIKPYLAHGVSVVVPAMSTDSVVVPVQKRILN